METLMSRICYLKMYTNENRTLNLIPKLDN